MQTLARTRARCGSGRVAVRSNANREIGVPRAWSAGEASLAWSDSCWTLGFGESGGKPRQSKMARACDRRGGRKRVWLCVVHCRNVTFERKIVVGLEEIRAITFECHKCKSRLTVSPDDIRDIPIACPHCNFSWRLPEDPSAVPSGSLPKAFAFGIRELKIRFGADVIGFKILLEFDEPGRHAL